MKSLVKTIFVLFLLTQLLSCQKEDASTAERLISSHKILFDNPPKKIPVPHSVDAPMLGNGFTGVAISGNPEKQVYYIARNDFWRLKSSFNQSFPAVLAKVEIDTQFSKY